MKNILTWVIAMLLLCPAKSYTQTMDINRPGLTLDSVVANIQTTITADDTGEGGRADQLKFFQTFWERRRGSYDNASG